MDKDTIELAVQECNQDSEEDRLGFFLLFCFVKIVFIFSQGNLPAKYRGHFGNLKDNKPYQNNAVLFPGSL